MRRSPLVLSAEVSRLKQDLVRACRILSHEGILDSSGHISVRIPGTRNFLIHPRMAAGLATHESLLVLQPDGTPMTRTESKPPIEWPIHASIYRTREDVNSVMHSHSRMSRIFSVSLFPFRPLYGLALNHFDSAGMPVYRGCGTITTLETGHDLAAVLGQQRSVLLRGHGNVVVGSGITQTVICALMFEQMAETLHDVLSHGEPEYFTEEEASLWRRNTGTGGWQKAWEYYCRRAGC